MKKERPENAFYVKHRVLYADTDKMGVVYHSTYLRFAEIGRAELMRSKGLSYRQFEDTGKALPIIETHMRHLAPAHYDDEIDIITWLDEVSSASITFFYHIEFNGKLLVECYTKHTCIDSDGHVIKLPQELIEITT